MRGYEAALLVALLSGCLAAPTNNPEVRAYPCVGMFADGTPVFCEQQAALPTIEPEVPLGWTTRGDAGSTRFDRQEFFRSPTGQLGVWFEASPRHEGDFASPHPTRYGGVMRVGDGPVVAWESESPRGFIRYPPTESGLLSLPLLQPVAFTLYVPIINSDMPSIANGTMEILWAAGASDGAGGEPVRSVLKVNPTEGPALYIHDGLPDALRVGNSVRLDLGVFHVYVLLGCGCQA